MIKKIEIHNYGPFKSKKNEIEFNEEFRPTYIIGLNDTGKSMLFRALISSSNKKKGLDAKYCSGNSEKSSYVKLIFKIKSSNSLTKSLNSFKNKERKELKEKMDKIFEESFEIKTFPNKSVTAEEKLEIIKKNPLTSELFSAIFEKINRLVGTPIIDFSDLSDITIKRLIKKYSNPKLKPYFEILQKFQTEIFNIFFENTFFLSSVSNNYFDSIKSSYRIRDERGKPSEIEEFKKLIKPFVGENKLNEFMKIIKDDEMSTQERAAKLDPLEKLIEKKIKSFFDKYFISDNFGLKFQIRVDHGWNVISFNVKDFITKNFKDFSNRSDGFKWFFKLYVILKNAKDNSTIIIDEPEKFLHISIQRQLSKIFVDECKERNIQVIFITHSPFIFPDMNTAPFMEDIRIVIKQENSSVIIDRILDDKEIKNKKEVLSPLADAMGINVAQLLQCGGIKQILLVEGKADWYTIDCAAKILGKTISDEFWIIPMKGSGNTSALFVLSIFKDKKDKKDEKGEKGEKDEGINIKVLFDHKKESGAKFSEKTIEQINLFLGGEIKHFFLEDIMEDESIKSPEDFLEEDTQNKVKELLKTDNKLTHADIWEKIWQSLNSDKNKGSILTINDQKQLKKFFEKLVENKLVLLEEFEEELQAKSQEESQKKSQEI